MGEWLLSRRDRLIVAWHEVPGSTPPQNSRPVGYGVIRAGVRAESMIGVRNFKIRRLKTFTLDVGLARYAKHNANFVLVVSGSLETQRTKKFIEIVYDLLIKAIELSSFALLKFGVRPEGLK